MDCGYAHEKKTLKTNEKISNLAVGSLFKVTVLHKTSSIQVLHPKEHDFEEYPAGSLATINREMVLALHLFIL